MYAVLLLLLTPAHKAYTTPVLAPSSVLKSSVPNSNASICLLLFGESRFSLARPEGHVRYKLNLTSFASAAVRLAVSPWQLYSAEPAFICLSVGPICDGTAVCRPDPRPPSDRHRCVAPWTLLCRRPLLAGNRWRGTSAPVLLQQEVTVSRNHAVRKTRHHGVQKSLNRQIHYSRPIELHKHGNSCTHV